MRKALILSVFAALLLAGHAKAQTFSDPCTNPAFQKQSVPISIASATTTALVPLTAGKSVYVCGWSATFGGTTPTLIFKTGTRTSTDCDTNAASLSGTYAPTAGAYLREDGSTLYQTPQGYQFCATTGGTPSIQGHLNYVIAQ